jgi:hypothetical protein
MGNAVNTERIFINDKDIAEFGARALRDSIKIGGTELDNNYFQGRNRTHYTLMSSTFGLKKISFTLVYEADNLRLAKEYKSSLEALMYGSSEIHMPDGFYYRSMLQNIGEEQAIGADGFGVLVSATYEFLGVQHDTMQEVDVTMTYTSPNYIGTLNAKGTMPKTDCILIATASSAGTLVLGGASFTVAANDVITVDGIYKRFLKNGAPILPTTWSNFPSLVAGSNSIVAKNIKSNVVKVKYYPTYI